MNIPDKAVDAAKSAGDSFGLELTSSDLEQLLEAAAPFIAAQAWDEGWDAHADCEGCIDMCGTCTECLPDNPYRDIEAGN